MKTQVIQKKLEKKVLSINEMLKIRGGRTAMRDMRDEKA